MTDTIILDGRDQVAPNANAFMHLWTIYRHPSDYPPGTWVARRSEVHKNNTVLMTGDVRVAQSKAELRGMLPVGLYMIPRMADEDPVIEEHWV